MAAPSGRGARCAVGSWAYWHASSSQRGGIDSAFQGTVIDDGRLTANGRVTALRGAHLSSTARKVALRGTIDQTGGAFEGTLAYTADDGVEDFRLDARDART